MKIKKRFDTDGVKVIKKSGLVEGFEASKITAAIEKSARRAQVSLTDEQKDGVVSYVLDRAKELDAIPVEDVHSLVELALDEFAPSVAEQYRSYRDHKANFREMMGGALHDEVQGLIGSGTKENANANSKLVSAKKALTGSATLRAEFKSTFLTPEELFLSERGDIYIHDMSDRLLGINCCLFRAGEVLKGGYELEGIWHNEPKTLDKAFDQIADLVMTAASQQYGGFTLPRVDAMLAPYAEKSFKMYTEKYISLGVPEDRAKAQAMEDVRADYRQGFQSWEHKFNTVSSARGDFPFVTVTAGLGTSEFEKMGNIEMFKNHMRGQGKEGFRKPVLFPKYVFLYDKDLHGRGKELGDVYEAALECSSKTMYPDWLSLTGNGYVPQMYKQYKAVVSPMGCRAFLSPYFEKGGQSGPVDENDKPVFEGRFNSGAISLNLPLIYMISKVEKRDFYEVLDERLETIRDIHKRTKEYIGNLYAASNPLGFTQGGFYGGNLRLDQQLKESKDLMESTTYSFGVTALNELQRAYNGKSIAEDGKFALEVMEHINAKAIQFKEEDHMLYAIYGTPAENLCLAGDTEVQCYGGNKQIKDIKPGDLVYSFNEDLHKIELKPVCAQYLTQTNAECVKVTFDNGQSIICTPNHPFAVRILPERDILGRFTQKEHIEYVNASDLKPGDRIKSNYMSVNASGRWECSLYHNGRKQLVQDINAEYSLGEKPVGCVTHHKDQDKLNNNFDNLEYLTDKEHRILHLNQTIRKFQYSSDQCMGENNPFFGKHHTQESNLKNRLAHIGKPIYKLSENGEILDFFECADVAEKAGYTRNLVVQACKGTRKIAEGPHYYKNAFWYYAEDCGIAAGNNHKVVSVEKITKKYDVYDITVEDNHNFFVGGNDGILVHNCGKQIRQMRAFVKENEDSLKDAGYDIKTDPKSGELVIENVCDRPYVSNSFHCHVTEHITPIQKQDLEERYWNLFNGGKIQYVRYPVDYNKDAVEALVTRAMGKGFYEGVNMDLSYCDDCGYEQLEMDVCPHCGSRNLTKIDRMNGYLGYSRQNGESRFAKHKDEEFADRVSM